MSDEEILEAYALDSLRRELKRYSTIRKHASYASIDRLPREELLDLAARVGLDASEHMQRAKTWHYSNKWPGFEGELEFELTFEALGNKVTRKARVVYQHTPEWEYLDRRKKAPYVGWEGSRYHIEIMTVPEEHFDDGSVTFGEGDWVEMGDLVKDDVLPHEFWDGVLNAVDERCKIEDAERRRTAAMQIARPRPKRRH